MTSFSSHAVSMTLRVDVASGSQIVKNETIPIQFFDALWSGIKLRTINITKLLFSKHRVNMNDSYGEQIENSAITMKLRIQLKRTTS